MLSLPTRPPTLWLASHCGTQEVRKTVGTAEHVSCAEDAAMNEGKQSLQGDVTGSRCLEGVCGKNMLDVCLRASAGRSDTACTHKS